MQLLETPIPVSQNPKKIQKGSGSHPVATITNPNPKTQINFKSADTNVICVQIATSAFQWKRMFMNCVPTGGFTISLELPPGTHDYKFIVGGVWQCDPSNPMHKTGDHENNFIVVTDEKDELQQPTRDLIEVAKYLHAIMEIETCTTSTSDIKRAINLVRDHGLVREQIPTHLLNSPDIWSELLKSKGANGKHEGMPIEAMIRNLGKMSSLPIFMINETTRICARLLSDEDIQRSRVHPFKVLVGSMTYGAGKALKGALSWPVSFQVHDQLTQTFLKAFKNVTPTGKRYMVALDVSGSMDTPCMGCPAISCRQASAALALMLYETEPHVYLRGFSAAHVPGAGFYDFDPCVRRGMTLNQFIKATNTPFGSTDCSLPMLRAIHENLNVDAFIVMTDNETFAGRMHPQVALENYRKHANKPNVKLIVVGMTANSLTIADPNDRNTLNLAGFDTAMPEIIAMFVRGEL
jgi:60 kDa SS-A/Ro ribonucleoprotein